MTKSVFRICKVSHPHSPLTFEELPAVARRTYCAALPRHGLSILAEATICPSPDSALPVSTDRQLIGGAGGQEEARGIWTNAGLRQDGGIYILSALVGHSKE